MKYTPSMNKELVNRKWYLIDLKDQVLGRIASRTAMILTGKHKPTYTPHVDTGDFVVAINASQMKLTGKKVQNKVYRHYTGYPGGLRTLTVEKLIKDDPAVIFFKAVKGMMPKNPLGRKMVQKLKVYAGDKHPHHSQQPTPIIIVK